MVGKTTKNGKEKWNSTNNRSNAPLAFDMGSKKAGHPVDRNTAEKITDGARSAYEKATGKTVNPKISN